MMAENLPSLIKYINTFKNHTWTVNCTWLHGDICAIKTKIQKKTLKIARYQDKIHLKEQQ